jgi:hypothetical protein
MRLAVLNIVGLSKSLLGENAPGMTAFAEKHGLQTYKPAFPALTTTAQSSILTGTPPEQHGIVANGWYDRESAEVRFWKQSNHIVHGEKIWDTLRRELKATNPNFTCAKLRSPRARFTLRMDRNISISTPSRCQCVMKSKPISVRFPSLPSGDLRQGSLLRNGSPTQRNG